MNWNQLSLRWKQQWIHGISHLFLRPRSFILCGQLSCSCLLLLLPSINDDMTWSTNSTSSIAKTRWAPSPSKVKRTAATWISRTTTPLLVGWSQWFLEKDERSPWKRRTVLVMIFFEVVWYGKTWCDMVWCSKIWHDIVNLLTFTWYTCPMFGALSLGT